MKQITGKRVYLVSLGCAKNRVDSEKTLAILKGQNCDIAQNPEDADCILINSCGFIDAARRETIDTILDFGELKKTNPSIKLAVMGCMVELFKNDMAKELPEIDYLVGLSDESASEIYRPDNIERTIEPGATYAYLKIAEGCGNSCSFCSIPIIRGPLKSRQPEDIAKEAGALLKKGVKEICLVSQDTTRYGADLKIKNGLEKLLRTLLKEKPPRLRVHYSYPTLVTDGLIELIADEPSICSYMDVPFQHIDSSVLKRMGRQESEGDILRLIEKIRKSMPNGAIRSSFIVGFPGETEAEFNRLKKFLNDWKLDHVGIFTYSPEENTKASELADDIPEELKEERKEILMEIQQEISFQKNRDKVGKVLPVLVDRFSDEDRLLLGRLETQAPEVDGEVVLDDCDSNPGEEIKVKIVNALEYDLVGKQV